MNTEPQNNDEIVWDLEDLKKARFYLDLEIAMLEEGE